MNKFALYCTAMSAVLLIAGGCGNPFDTMFELNEDERVPELNLDETEIVEQPPLILDDEGGVETAELAFDEETTGGYDPQNELTIRGPVLGKRPVKLADGSTGVVVELQPGGDFIHVLIGTTRFNEANGVYVDIADHIMVTGPIVDIDQDEFGFDRLMLARELTWRDRRIELRNEDGEPNWW